MKRVVVLSAFASPLRSGAEACAEEVALRLADRYDIVLVTARLRRDLPRRDLLGGRVPVVRVGFGFAWDKWLFPFLGAREARRQRPVLVHAVLETFAGAALLLCRVTVPGARRLLTCQTTNRRFFKTAIVRSPDAVTAISTHLVADVRRRRGGAVLHIPNGFDAEAFAAARRAVPRVPDRLLFVGRLEPVKGIDALLHAFAHLQRSHADTPAVHPHLQIVGDGSQREALERLAHALGVADVVTFSGRIAPDRIPSVYAAATVFCGLSRHEALGNVFLEAQAAGCVAIGTDCEGIRDIVPDACRVAPDAPPAVVAALLWRALTDVAWREAFHAEAAPRLQAYDWGAIAAQYAAVYQTLLA